MAEKSEKLSFIEKAGYSGGDAAANFVFMSMILFQANFYTDVMGIDAAKAADIILVARLWDAFFDPVMGTLADRTKTRWGRFRPWVIWTAVPWAVAMVLAYTTPHFGSSTIVFYAFVTNIALMTLYSANNMPYSALGAVMTGDVVERASLNSYRFISVNAAQFIVGGFTLVLVNKFAGAEHDRQRGWAMTMGLWAALCLVLFLITFLVSKERIQPPAAQKTPPKQDFMDLFANRPWRVMFCLTLVHFSILSMRGGAYYNYFHYYADKGALYDWVNALGLTAAPLAPGAPAPGGFLDMLGYVVHADRSNLANSNVADVANSLVNMIWTGITMVIILSSPALTRIFGKKAVAVTGFAFTAAGSFALYLVPPTNVWGMVIVTTATAICYAPTIPLIWAMFADVADYSEWKNGRSATGIIFATIGFALKAGLSLGSSMFLRLMSWNGYKANAAQGPESLEAIRRCSSVYVGILFSICTVLLFIYQIDKRLTIQIADELAARRKASQQTA